MLNAVIQGPHIWGFPFTSSVHHQRMESRSLEGGSAESVMEDPRRRRLTALIRVLLWLCIMISIIKLIRLLS